MAWRDGRKSWKRLLLYVSATSLGIAALIAAGSLQDNLEHALRLQAKPLVGADLVIRNRRAFDEKSEKLLSALPFPFLREVELNSVVFFPDKDGGRLLEVRAVEKGFPFYGEVKTEPAGALGSIHAGRNVVIEENVMIEFNLKPGDPVDIGSARFTVAAALKTVPGEAIASVFDAPAAFISLPALKDTGLLRDESLARHKMYFKIDDEQKLAAVIAELTPLSQNNTWRLNTVADRQRGLGRRAENASRFLKLAALIALLLGATGVASILFVYAKDKWGAAATLRCLGASGAQALGIFVLQGMFLGAAGTAIGAGLGLLLQAAFPRLLSHFILIDIGFIVSWRSLIGGALVGFCLTFLFSLLPLLSLRAVSPLAALRFADESTHSLLKDRAAWAVFAAALLLIFFFTKSQVARSSLAAGVPLSLAGSLLLLSLLTRFSLKQLRAHTPKTWPYAWRQGLANLFRPNNQTHVLVAALGLGSALIFTITFLNNSLLNHISLSTSASEPNLALIDIQRDQRAGVRQTLENANATVMDEVSFVTMRIEEIKGQRVDAPYEDNAGGGRGRNWALRREYRSTYRDVLGPSERVTVGAWPPAAFDRNGPIPVTLEESIADDLNVTVGDEIVFNVQGVPMKTTVAALRKVDWFQLRPNFFVIFPSGALEDAPQFTVMLARTDTVAKTAAAQKAVRAAFPNVSTVDLRMILETLNSYFSKVALALKFMALFVVATGFMILAGALISGRYERLREAALLRTLGAAAGEIRKIHVIEYGLIGLFSGAAGLFLGGAGSYLIAAHLFEIGFKPGLLPMTGGLFAMVAISVATGIFLGRGMLNAPPLETLRDDG